MRIITKNPTNKILNPNPKLESALVESNTNPGEFYHVQVGCTCKGFTFNQKCAHVRTVVNG